MVKSPASFRTLLMLGALLLAGCAMGPDYQRPAVPLPTTFGESASTIGAEVMPRWWTQYGDSQLTELVDRAVAFNHDVRIAAAQVDEAEAMLRQATASLFPQIDLGGAGTRSRSSALTATPLPANVPILRDDRRLAASTSFELDFWGKLRRANEAARAQMLATRYGQDTVMLGLAASTTQTWFTLRSIDAQTMALQDSLKAREASLELVKSRADAGLVSDLDLNQALGARAEVAAQLRELARQRSVLEHQLGMLTAQPGLKIAGGDLRTLPVPPIPPAGLASTLLDRRPDLKAAEQSLVAANAQIGAAKAALFPTISLTGNYGGQSAALESLLDGGARIWSAGFGLALPIFDAGRNLARVDQANSRQQQALFSYQRAIENAFREVADALSNARESALAETDLQVRLNVARDTQELSRARYEAGYSGFLEVLDAQRTANDAEAALIRNRQARLAYTVDLMKAVGGGWKEAGEKVQ